MRVRPGLFSLLICKKNASKLTGNLLPRSRNLLRSSMPFVRKFFHYKQIAIHFTGK
jgi:oligoribonuclease (3'-5' exoribonuclease)